jgi:hypothetical protein
MSSYIFWSSKFISWNLHCTHRNGQESPVLGYSSVYPTILRTGSDLPVLPWELDGVLVWLHRDLQCYTRILKHFTRQRRSLLHTEGARLTCRARCVICHSLWTRNVCVCDRYVTLRKESKTYHSDGFSEEFWMARAVWGVRLQCVPFLYLLTLNCRTYQCQSVHDVSQVFL